MLLCLVAGLDQAVGFLLGKGSDPHIEDLTGKDACDYVKRLPKFSQYPVFTQCDPRLRKRAFNRNVLAEERSPVKEEPKAEVVAMLPGERLPIQPLKEMARMEKRLDRFRVPEL